MEKVLDLFLKFLGKIYQWTGIYLGKYWEERYLRSNMDELYCMLRNSKWEDVSPECWIGISRGTWQCKYGFYRTMKASDWKFKK